MVQHIACDDYRVLCRSSAGLTHSWEFHKKQGKRAPLEGTKKGKPEKPLIPKLGSFYNCETLSIVKLVGG